MPPPPTSAAARSLHVQAQQNMDALDDLLDDFDQQKQHLPKLSPATIFQQEKALADFKQFLGVMQDRAKEKGRDWLAELPGAPKELGAVIEEGAPVMNVSVLQTYAKYRAQVSMGKLTESGRPTVETVKGNLTTLIAALNRKTGNAIASTVRLSVTSYIDTKLRETLGLEDAQREKAEICPSSLKVIASKALDAAFTPRMERERIHVLLCICMQMISGSRIGALIKTSSDGYRGKDHENRAVCYGDVKVYITQGSSDRSENQLFVDFTLRNTKTETGKGLTYTLTVQPVHHLFSGALYFLALALADEAFEQDLSVDQIFDPASLGSLKTKVLALKSSMSEVAVIRRSLADGEATAVQEAAGPDAAKDKALLHPKAAMHTNTYDAHLRRLCLLAGFKQTISSHRLRSFFITEALSAGIPLHMVQYAVGHRIGSDTWKRYISKRVNIDVMSIILGSKSQSEAIKSLSSMMLYHDDATPVKLTTEQRAELFAEPEIQACKRRQAEIMKSLEREGKTLATASDETQIEYKRAFMDQSNAYRRLYPVHLRKIRVKHHDRRHDVQQGSSENTDAEMDISRQWDDFPSSAEASFDCEAVEKAFEASDNFSLLDSATGIDEDATSFESLQDAIAAAADQACDPIESSSSSARSGSSSSYSGAGTSSSIHATTAEDQDSVLARLKVSALGPSSSKNYTVKLLEVIRTPFSNVSWWPNTGIVPDATRNGESVCVICGKTAEELELYVSRAPGEASHLKSNLSRKWRIHGFECLQAIAKAEVAEDLAARYETQMERNSRCPCCDGRVKHGTPNAWRIHLEKHFKGGVVSVNCCNEIHQSSSILQDHFATSHEIWAFGTNTSTRSFIYPEPRFYFSISGFLADPISVIEQSTADFGAVFETVGDTTKSFIGRTDLSSRLESPSSKAKDHGDLIDGRYDVRMLDLHARVASKHGYCHFCVWNTSLSYTERMRPYLQPDLRYHVLEEHILPMYIEHRLLLEKGAEVDNVQMTCLDRGCSLSQEPAQDIRSIYNHLVACHPFGLDMLADAEPGAGAMDVDEEVIEGEASSSSTTSTLLDILLYTTRKRSTTNSKMAQLTKWKSGKAAQEAYENRDIKKRKRVTKSEMKTQAVSKARSSNNRIPKKLRGTSSGKKKQAEDEDSSVSEGEQESGPDDEDETGSALD